MRCPMSKSKVLIHVVGGIAYCSSEGDVEVVVVDEDNIKAGDPPVQLGRNWEELARKTIDLAHGRIVQIA